MPVSDASASPHPLVSCLLVTADRPKLVQRALQCYRAQTYPNKELVVLDNGLEHQIDDLVAEWDEGDVVYKYVERTPDMWIGSLRNQALDLATGDYVVPQWDDDDWSHPERLTRQAAVLNDGYDACTLQATLMHVDGDTFFDHPFIGVLPNGVPPTIMHRRDAAIRYPNIRRTSDTDYVNDWREQRYQILPREDSYLYLRYFHGDNLWEKDHFIRRMRNTPKDLLLYAWHHYVKGDMFGHPRFQLTPTMQEAFEQYLRVSFEYDLFQARSAPAA